jgi:hypothetical protein
MVDKKLASSRLLVLATIIGLGMTLSGCSKSADSDRCRNVFTAALLSQPAHQNSPFEMASELRDHENDGVADLNDRRDRNDSDVDDDSDNSPGLAHFTPTPGSFSIRVDDYNVVTWDSRGQGESGGTLQINSPEFEGRDIQTIIDWLQDQGDLPNPF